jgi:hypothetical protein
VLPTVIGVVTPPTLYTVRLSQQSWKYSIVGGKGDDVGVGVSVFVGVFVGV